VRAGDGKRHHLFRPAANQPQQNRGHILEKDRLTDHQQNGGARVGVAMVPFQPLQPFTEEVQNQKKIADHENGINGQLDQESA